jgi:hypothetical protein
LRRTVFIRRGFGLRFQTRAMVSVALSASAEKDRAMCFCVQRFKVRGCLGLLSLRGVPLCGTTKQSSWIATARFAHLAMTVLSQTRARASTAASPCDSRFSS